MESFMYQFSELFVFIIFSVLMFFKQKGYFGKFLTIFPTKEYFYKLSARLDVIEMKLAGLQTQFNNMHPKQALQLK